MNLFEITIQRKINKCWPITALRHQPLDLLPVRSEDIINFDLSSLEDVLQLPDDYGVLLGQSVFQGEIKNAFLQALTDAKTTSTKLRVLLSVEDDDLRNLHWERLCALIDGSWDFLSINQLTTFSIYLPSVIDRRFPPLSRHELRALILVAGPEDLIGNYKLPKFDIEASIEGVCSSLGAIPYDVLASSSNAIGGPDLDTLCNRIASDEFRYTLLHIICHGVYKPDNNETILFFPDKDGRPVITSELIKRFRRIGPLPHFTFLSSCESAIPEADIGHGGAAQRMVRDLGMPAVLAMTDKISIESSEALTKVFYPRLYKHGEVDLAVTEALVVIQSKYDVTTPVLFSRLGNRPLFSDKTVRPLTKHEIFNGLSILKKEINVRAPILISEIYSLETQFNSFSNGDLILLNNIALEANKLCGEIFGGLSFTQLALGQEAPPYDNRCPFPGLSPFRNKDKEFFFGRNELIDQIIDKTNVNPFLAILGPSGSGKSSLVMAGLSSRLEIPPIYFVPGNEPIDTLEQNLINISSQSNLIIVDQFEELFTLTKNDETRIVFIKKLLESTDQHKVIIVLRSDFLGECSRYENLRSEIENNLILISPINEGELPKVVQRQVDGVGLHFDDGLISKIIEDVTDEPGAMPLLQHALWRLWERRRGYWLRYKEYLAFGGIKQAIANTADEFYDGLNKNEQKILREIFLRLVKVEEIIDNEYRDTRRRVSLSELIPIGANRELIIELIRNLANMRLVVTSVNEKTNVEEVELSHEALIKYWPKLRIWLEEDRADLRLRESIRSAALDWQKGNREKSFLIHRGGRLDDAIVLSKQTKITLNTMEIKYVNACVTLRDKEKKEIENRRKRITFGLLIGLIIMVGLTLIAYAQRAEMQKQRKIALDSLFLAQTQLIDVRDSKNAFTRLGLAIEADNRLSNPESYQLLWSSTDLFRSQDLYLKTNNPVASICFSPDSKILVSKSVSKINPDLIQVWDAENGTQRLQIILNDSIGGDEVVNKILCSPDGKRIVSSGIGKHIFIWDILTGEKLNELIHDDIVTDFALSPDGRNIISGSRDGQIRIWDNDTGHLERIFLNENRISGLAISQNGNFLASVDTNGIVIIWDLLKDETLKLITGTNELSIVFSPNNDLVVTGGRDGTIIFWDVKNGERIKTISQKESIIDLSFSPKGDLLFSSDKDGLSKIWAIDSFSDVSSHRTYGPINSASFSPNNETVAFGGFSGYTEVFNLGSIDIAGYLPIFNVAVIPNEGRVNQVLFSPDGRKIGSASENGDVIISPFTTNKLHHNSQVWNIEFNYDNDLIVTSSRDGTARIWNVETGHKVFDLVHGNWVNFATFSPDAKYVATASSDQTAKLWNVSDGREIFTIPHTSNVIDITFSPDGKLVASAGWDGITQVWQINDRSRVFEILHDDKINRVHFSPNNKWIITASDDNKVKVWDLKDRYEVLQLNHNSAVTDISVTPTSDYIISGDQAGNIIMWDMVHGENIFETNMEMSKIQVISISPDGIYFAAGNEQGDGCVWQIDNRKKILCISTDKAIWDIIFSASNFMFAGSSDGYVHIWDLNSRTEYGRILLPGLVLSLDLSSDNKFLAMSTTAGLSRFVEWDREDIISIACDRLPRQISREEWDEYLGDSEYSPFCNSFITKR